MSLKEKKAAYRLAKSNFQLASKEYAKDASESNYNQLVIYAKKLKDAQRELPVG